MSALTVARTWHEDWLVNVLLSDGRIYTFMTEIWPEWLDAKSEDDWTPVIDRAKDNALFLASRNAEPFCVVPDVSLSDSALWSAVDVACMAMSDSDFRARVR